MPLDLSFIQGTTVIIPAAGIGRRMGGEVPKQYLKVSDEYILDITLEKFLSYKEVELIVLVVSPDDTYVQKLKHINNDKIVLIDGGAERVDSVFNALKFLLDNVLPDHMPVMVHDAARPCITHGDLDLLLKQFLESREPCLLAAQVVDTLQEIDTNNQVFKRLNRQHIIRAMTPQIAEFGDLKTAIKQALKENIEITGGVSALTHAGHQVTAVIGRSDNIKVTLPEDLLLAESIIKHTEQ